MEGGPLKPGLDLSGAVIVAAESEEMTLPAVLKTRQSPCMRTI